MYNFGIYPEKEVTMISKNSLQKAFLSVFIIFAFMFNAVAPASAQGDFVTSGRIGGGSSVYVFRGSSKAKKSNYASKRRSSAKRTKKQRRATRRKVARQSRSVARKNRNRRSTKAVTPQELEEIQVERKTPQEASVVLAGAGEYYVGRDDFEKAVGFFEQAIELDANNTDAKLALSEVYTMLGDQTLEKADEYAEKAAEAVAAGNQADVQKFLTQEKFARQKAEKDFRRAIELDPKNSSAYASLGGYLDSLDTEDSEKEAKMNYEKALEIDPELTSVKAPLGIIYYQEGLIDKADRYISEALAGGEDNAETQLFAGLIRYKQNRNEEAKKALETSIRLDDESAEAHYYLGATLSRLGEEDRAIEEYIRSTELDPKFVNAWFDLGVAYYNREMYQQAIKAFDNAIDLNMHQSEEEKRIYAESFANLAETYRQIENYDLAISKYRNAVDLIEDPELYSTFAFVLARDEKWSEAIRTFEKVTALKPDAISFGNLGWAYYQESQNHARWGRSDREKDSLLKAKAALERAVQTDPDFAAPHLNLGLTLNDLGEHKEAVKVLEKATELRKDWVFAVNELAIAYRKNGDYDKAIKEFERAIKMDKNYAYAYYGLGETHVARGRLKDAEKVHKDLRKLDARLADKLGNLIAKAKF